MKISVAMIVLDDAKNTYNALKSADFADEIIVVDGGSTDGTLFQIGKYQEESPDKIRVFSNKWERDFSKQRNISFQKCTGDWIIRLDSDEIFGVHLRGAIQSFLGELPQECLSVRIRQNNIIDEYLNYASNLGGWETHPRIFRNTRDLNWKGQVHEFIENVSHKCTDWNVCVIHFGWVDRDKLKKKEDQYRMIPGSGFATEGSLSGRHYEIRKLPERIF